MSKRTLHLPLRSFPPFESRRCPGLPGSLPTCVPVADAARSPLLGAEPHTHGERYTAEVWRGKDAHLGPKWAGRGGRAGRQPRSCGAFPCSQGRRASCALRNWGAGWVPSAGRPSEARGSPPPLTLLSSCLHLFLPSTPFSHCASLTFSPLLPLLPDVSSLPSTDAWRRTGEGKSPVSLT